MVDEGRSRLDELRQANATVAAMREVWLLIISDRLEAGMAWQRTSALSDTKIAPADEA
jgi:hypothetical protein